MLLRIGSLLALISAPAFCGDWSPRLAADYMDARQKAWFAWPVANKANGVCLSCHTGLTYLLARPALGRALGENVPSAYQTQLLDTVRKRLSLKTAEEFSPTAKEPSRSQAFGVESVLAPLLLAAEDARRGTLSKETEQAFERMWSAQIVSGKDQGAWIWNSYDLDPWEEPDSAFYGAALAALAVGTAPAGYQSRPEIQANLESLKKYLAGHQAAQPLHNRLALLWASAKLPGVITDAQRKTIVQETLRRQQPDGGWTLESLGAWSKHPNAPPSEGSNAYATAVAAFTLRQAGAGKDGVHRALDWLRAHQDPQAGYWDAPSMNKKYEADSMPLHFMRDAATAFASLALADSASPTHTN